MITLFKLSSVLDESRHRHNENAPSTGNKDVVPGQSFLLIKICSIYTRCYEYVNVNTSEGQYTVLFVGSK